MSIVRWDPFKNIATLQDRINRLFEDAFPSKSGGEDFSSGDWKPLADIYDKGDSIMICMEIPGVKKEDVSIEVRENILTLKGSRAPDTDIKEENYYRRERNFGSFQRAFTLPPLVDPDNIRAKFKDGILEVEIPKPEESKPKQITVKVE
jgi:HSP20 family protein